MAANPLAHTWHEWEMMGDEKYTATAPALGARPFHSNYHFCAVLHALRHDEPVEPRVVGSYEGTCRALLENASQDEEDRLRREVFRLGAQLAVVKARAQK